MKRPLLALLLLPLAAGPVVADTPPPLLLQRPAVSQTHVAFGYAGDLWIVGRQGGDGTRLTSGTGLETAPVFSPDGTQVAFAGEYERTCCLFGKAPRDHSCSLPDDGRVILCPRP
jgi:tricorn protease